MIILITHMVQYCTKISSTFAKHSFLEFLQLSAVIRFSLCSLYCVQLYTIFKRLLRSLIHKVQFLLYRKVNVHRRQLSTVVHCKLYSLSTVISCSFVCHAQQYCFIRSTVYFRRLAEIFNRTISSFDVQLLQ